MGLVQKLKYCVLYCVKMDSIREFSVRMAAVHAVEQAVEKEDGQGESPQMMGEGGSEVKTTKKKSGGGGDGGGDGDWRSCGVELGGGGGRGQEVGVVEVELDGVEGKELAVRRCGCGFVGSFYCDA